MKTITVKRKVQIGDVIQNVKTKEKIVVRESDFATLVPDEWEFIGECYCVNPD